MIIARRNLCCFMSDRYDPMYHHAPQKVPLKFEPDQALQVPCQINFNYKYTSHGIVNYHRKTQLLLFYVWPSDMAESPLKDPDQTFQLWQEIIHDKHWSYHLNINLNERTRHILTGNYQPYFLLLYVWPTPSNVSLFKFVPDNFFQLSCQITYTKPFSCHLKITQHTIIHRKRPTQNLSRYNISVIIWNQF